MLRLLHNCISSLAKDLPETVISNRGIVKRTILIGRCLLLLRGLDEGARSGALS